MRVVESAGLLSPERLDGLTHIGIDELSYRKHHQYITVVTDHATGRVVWAGEGKSSECVVCLSNQTAADLIEGPVDQSLYMKAIEDQFPRLHWPTRDLA